ncbi:DMT family transporter [Phenylobacterium sp.]|uniref:DMT family transporter n=2 Tax=Phenylobacterium sp. TaxID=1871053 RepID=UPI0025FCED9E|nr:DMT family transporter [Phenylobacterium sp.]
MTDVAETAGRERRTAMMVLLAGACIIGLAPILVRLGEAGPSAIGFWRMIFALPLLALIARRESGGVGPTGWILGLAGVAFALDLAFWHYGIALTSVAKATILSNLTPVIVTGVAWLVFREKVRPLFLTAVALAVGGACLMTLARDPGLPGVNPPLGDAFSAMTAVWYALYFLAVQRARQTRGAAQVMFWSSLTAAPLLLAASAALGERFLPATPVGWAACVGLGIVHATGQGAIAWALGRLPASVTSVVVLVQPVVAAVLGWLLFGEVFGPGQMLGGAIALTGVVLAQRAARPAAQAG